VVFKTSADVTLWTQDDAGAFPFDLSNVIGSLSDANVTHIASGTGAVSRTVQSVLRDVISVKDFGATGNGSTDDTSAIQSALDAHAAIYFPDGTYKITAALNLNSYNVLRFESRSAIIQGALAGPLIQGKAGTTTRTYHAQIFSGQITNTSRATAGGVGIDFKSMSMAKVFGTFITNVETGVKNGGTSAQGAFYNEFHGVDISGVVTGVSNGTLGNDAKFFGGRVNDSTTGTKDNDCSGNLYCGVAVETFATVGHLNSDTASATNIKYMFSRLENAPTSGLGIDIRAAAQICSYLSPQFVGLTTNISDASTTADTYGWSDDGLRLKSGTPIKKHQRVTAVIDFPNIAAGATADQAVTITGALATDSVFATPDAALEAGLMCCAVPSAGQHYVRLANVTAGAINPGSHTYTVDIWRH
jgi:hypothetical protein